MNKFSIYALMSLMSVPFMSCSDDEELLEPTVGVVENKFAVPDDATGPEADLRREFFESTGMYLMFSDLLSHEYIGTDAYGDDMYRDEYIDFNYNLTSTSSDEFRIYFLEDDFDVKKRGAELVKKYIYPHIEGGDMSPFSILIVDNLEQYDYYDGEWDVVKTISCWRCRAIAVGDWLAISDEDLQAEYSRSILKEIVSARYNYSSDEADDFMDLSYEYSYEYLTDLYDDWDRSDISLVYELGYIDYVQSWRGPSADYLPYATSDFDDFFDAVMDRTEEDFMAEFGDYQMIVTKYNLMKNAIISLGYKF